jgi:hypothetical protein
MGSKRRGINAMKQHASGTLLLTILVI